MIKGALFDFDGVIADSKSMHFQSWEFAVHRILSSAIDFTPSGVKSGASPVIIAQSICDNYKMGDKHELLLACKNNYLQENLHKTEPFQSIPDVFNFLNESEIPYGIASNASRDFVRGCLDSWNLKAPLVYGYEDYKFPKPNPEPYLKLAQNLNIQSKDFNEVVVFEDSETGLKAALAAGMKTIHIKSHCEVSSIILERVDYKFDKVVESLSLLKDFSNS